MPQILRQVVFGAAGTNPNIWSGSAFEYVRQNAVLSMACAQTVAANFITVNVGSDVIAEEHEPHVIAAASVYPIIPDHFYYQDVAAAMDRLVMSLRATVAVTFKAVALITGIQDVGNIQRAPQGLLDLLSLKGVESLPKDFAGVVSPTLDVLQFYAAQQRSVQTAANGALAEGASLGIGPIAQWLVLYAASFTVTKTATMTALEVQLGIRLNNDVFQEIALRAEELGPFGATETGTVTSIHWCPYPLLLPPNTLVIGRMGILGTDATASCVMGALVGILG